MPLKSFDTIIVPLDGSEGGYRALRHAVELAQAADLKLHLLHVFPVGSTELMDLLHYPEIAKAKAEGELRRAREDEAVKIFPSAREMVPPDVTVEEVTLSGDVDVEILNYAQSHPEAMIVMGTKGHSQVTDVLLGSVANKVVHRARCPVTVVH
jgi:nucleotide-binding universal stress UspA family protein